MAGRRLTDKSDEAVELLRIIASESLGLEPADTGDVTNIEQTIEQTGMQRPDEPTIVTSGPSGKTVDDEWDDFEWGFNAVTVNIRFTDDVLIAFGEGRPEGEPGRMIPLFHPDDAPFTAGGEQALNARRVWVRKAPTADDEDATVHVIAKR